MTALLTEPRLRSARLLLAALLAVGLVAACGSDTSRKPSSLEDKVRVSGTYGEKPTITIASPLKVPASRSWTLTQGDGDTVNPDSTAILQLTMADARTGKTVVSTYDKGQRPLEASLSDQFFPSLIKGLTGARSGSRIVIASSAQDSYGDQGAPQLGIKAGDAVVMVADIVSADPTKLEPRLKTKLDSPLHPSQLSSPRLVEGESGPTGFQTFGPKPKKVKVRVLRAGKGRPIDGPKRIAADYLGVVWGGKKQPFDSSYTKEPLKFSVGTGGVIPCWDQGLAGVRAGSRVVLVCPPATAYGSEARPGIPANSTLVFVVDVLGVG